MSNATRRTAISICVFGIIIPFGCGVLLGELRPETLLPNPATRLITTLFLGTALSISSVKIVALVVRELGFLRRPFELVAHITQLEPPEASIRMSTCRHCVRHVYC
jgi:Kef-type K+ transport system membrane component KefB